MIVRSQIRQKLEALQDQIGGTVKDTTVCNVPYLGLAERDAAVFWMWESKCWLVFRKDHPKQRVATMGEVLDLLKDSTHATD